MDKGKVSCYNKNMEGKILVDAEFFWKVVNSHDQLNKRLTLLEHKEQTLEAPDITGMFGKIGMKIKTLGNSPDKYNLDVVLKGSVLFDKEEMTQKFHSELDKMFQEYGVLYLGGTYHA